MLMGMPMGIMAWLALGRGALAQEGAAQESPDDENARMLPFHSFVAPFVAMAPNTMRRTVSDERVLPRPRRDCVAEKRTPRSSS